MVPPLSCFAQGPESKAMAPPLPVTGQVFASLHRKTGRLVGIPVAYPAKLEIGRFLIFEVPL